MQSSKVSGFRRAHDRVDFSLAYLDAQFTDFQPNLTTDFSDRNLDRSPTWAATLGYQYTFDLDNGGEIVAAFARVTVTSTR